MSVKLKLVYFRENYFLTSVLISLMSFDVNRVLSSISVQILFDIDYFFKIASTAFKIGVVLTFAPTACCIHWLGVSLPNL